MIANVSRRAHYDDWHHAEQTFEQWEPRHLHLSFLYRAKKTKDIAAHQSKTLGEMSFQKIQISPQATALFINGGGGWTSTIQTSNP